MIDFRSWINLSATANNDNVSSIFEADDSDAYSPDMQYIEKDPDKYAKEVEDWKAAFYKKPKTDDDPSVTVDDYPSPYEKVDVNSPAFRARQKEFLQAQIKRDKDTAIEKEVEKEYGKSLDLQPKNARQAVKNVLIKKKKAAQEKEEKAAKERQAEEKRRRKEARRQRKKDGESEPVKLTPEEKLADKKNLNLFRKEINQQIINLFGFPKSAAIDPFEKIKTGILASRKLKDTRKFIPMTDLMSTIISMMTTDGILKGLGGASRTNHAEIKNLPKSDDGTLSLEVGENGKSAVETALEKIQFNASDMADAYVQSEFKKTKSLGADEEGKQVDYDPSAAASRTRGTAAERVGRKYRMQDLSFDHIASMVARSIKALKSNNIELAQNNIEKAFESLNQEIEIAKKTGGDNYEGLAHSKDWDKLINDIQDHINKYDAEKSTEEFQKKTEDLSKKLESLSGMAEPSLPSPGFEKLWKRFSGVSKDKDEKWGSFVSPESKTFEILDPTKVQSILDIIARRAEGKPDPVPEEAPKPVFTREKEDVFRTKETPPSGLAKYQPSGYVPRKGRFPDIELHPSPWRKRKESEFPPTPPADISPLNAESFFPWNQFVIDEARTGLISKSRLKTIATQSNYQKLLKIAPELLKNIKLSADSRTFELDSKNMKNGEELEKRYLDFAEEYKKTNPNRKLTFTSWYIMQNTGLKNPSTTYNLISLLNYVLAQSGIEMGFPEQPDENYVYVPAFGTSYSDRLQKEREKSQEYQKSLEGIRQQISDMQKEDDEREKKGLKRLHVVTNTKGQSDGLLMGFNAGVPESGYHDDISAFGKPMPELAHLRQELKSKKGRLFYFTSPHEKERYYDPEADLGRSAAPSDPSHLGPRFATRITPKQFPAGSVQTYGSRKEILKDLPPEARDKYRSDKAAGLIDKKSIASPSRLVKVMEPIGGSQEEMEKFHRDLRSQPDYLSQITRTESKLNSGWKSLFEHVCYKIWSR